MTDLRIGQHRIENYFRLLGEREDSISLAIAWALSRSDAYLRRFLEATTGLSGQCSGAHVQVHRYEDGGGITDIEVFLVGHFHIIVEAKKGWNLPGEEQLSRYAGRESFWAHDAIVRRLVTFSECSQEYAGIRLPVREIKGVPVVHVSLQEMVAYAQSASRECGHAEKRLLRDLIDYLGGVMTTQRKDSNWVFVVSLSGKRPKGWGLTRIEVVTLCSRYFHPLVGRWPKEPPAYIAFRYKGHLQSIHYIESYEVITDLGKASSEIPSTPVDPHFLYHLGLAIRPSQPVKSGKLWGSGRVWCALDTLLTSSTVAEARDSTIARVRRPVE